MGHSIYDLGQYCRPAWNAGRKLGAKGPLQPRQVWAVRFRLEQEHDFEIARCSISQSTVSYVTVTW